MAQNQPPTFWDNLFGGENKENQDPNVNNNNKRPRFDATMNSAPTTKNATNNVPKKCAPTSNVSDDVDRKRDTCQPDKKKIKPRKKRPLPVFVTSSGRVDGRTPYSQRQRKRRGQPLRFLYI